MHVEIYTYVDVGTHVWVTASLISEIQIRTPANNA
jgi:hypothetical protein